MALPKEFTRPNNGKKGQRDYAHHSRRRERFREEGNRAMAERFGNRDVFGKREEETPRRRWFSRKRAT